MHDYVGNWTTPELFTVAHGGTGTSGSPRYTDPAERNSTGRNYGETRHSKANEDDGMKIKILLFGILKEVVGRPAETLDLADGTRVRDVLAHYSKEADRFKGLAPSLAIAVNQEYAALDRMLHEGDEVGLLPPVSGGLDDEPGDVIQIVRSQIDAESIIAGLKQPSDGAVVIFDGIVRDNTRGRRTLYLNYEAYEEMALKQMKALAAKAKSRFAVRSAAIIHRLGRLEIGETSVLIVVASAHRGAAFEACRWIIDTLKKTVPIWKKEYFSDGAVWADGEPFPEEIQRPGGTAGASPHPTD
jgi:molybdopterin converting factor subunit 1